MIWTMVVVTMVFTRRRGRGSGPIVDPAQRIRTCLVWEFLGGLLFTCHFTAHWENFASILHDLDTPGIRSMPACYYNPFPSSSDAEPLRLAHTPFVPVK